MSTQKLCFGKQTKRETKIKKTMLFPRESPFSKALEKGWG